MKNELVFFVVLNIVNVIVQTWKSLATVKGNKWVASSINALAYGIYTVLLVYIAKDYALWFKVVSVSGANLVGVFVVKWIEERNRKSKLWKVEATVYRREWSDSVKDTVKSLGLSHSYIDIGDRIILYLYCSDRHESRLARELLNRYNAKYFVVESKVL